MKFLPRILNSASFFNGRNSHENKLAAVFPALAMAVKADDLAGGVQPAMLDVLAMAYAEIGQFTIAQQAATDTLKLATAYGMTNDVPLIKERLQLYQNRQPLRQSCLCTNAPAGELKKD